jgi:hypothetical protein
MSLLKVNYHSPFHEKECRYTWQDFYQFEKESTYLLSEKVSAILMKLSEDVGIPANAFVNENSNMGHSGQYRQNSGNHRLNGNGGGGNRGINIRNNGGRGNGNKLGGGVTNNRGSISNQENWENTRKENSIPFINKKEKEEGVEKTIQDIRVCLNKMTDKNYIKQRDEIREKMKSLSNDCEETEIEKEEGGMEKKEEKEEEYKKVAKILFDIASTNKFFSKIYAQLYLELTEEFIIFQELLDVFLEGFIVKLQTIHYIDPDNDYDGYCLYIKQQDERKAMTGFLVHLAIGYLAIGEKGYIMVEKLEKIVLELIDKVNDLIDKEGNTNEVEEITEILFLFFSLGDKKLLEEWKKRELWGEISEKLMYLSKQKVKEHKSFSSRALFKFLDIQKLMG